VAKEPFAQSPNFYCSHKTSRKQMCPTPWKLPAMRPITVKVHSLASIRNGTIWRRAVLGLLRRQLHWENVERISLIWDYNEVLFLKLKVFLSICLRTQSRNGWKGFNKWHKQTFSHNGYLYTLRAKKRNLIKSAVPSPEKSRELVSFSSFKSILHNHC